MTAVALGQGARDRVEGGGSARRRAFAGRSRQVIVDRAATSRSAPSTWTGGGIGPLDDAVGPDHDHRLHQRVSTAPRIPSGSSGSRA